MFKKIPTSLFWFGSIALLLTFLYMVKAILLPFIVGMLVAYFLDPAADRLEKYGLSRTMATVSITAIFFSLLAVITIILIPLISQEISSLVVSLPGYLHDLHDWALPYIETALKYVSKHSIDESFIKDNGDTIKEASGKIIGITFSFMGGVLKSGLAVFNLLSLILLTPIVAFFLLKDWDNIIEKTNALLPRKTADKIRAQVKEIDKTLSGYIHGQVNVCLVMMTYYSLGLSIIGLKYGLTIGLLTGFLAFVPFVGSFTGLTIGIIIALTQFDNNIMVIMVAAVFLVGMMIDGNFITPKLVGSKVGLHPMWLIFGMLAGGALFGFVGIFIAVPATAVIAVLIRFTVQEYLESPLYDKP